ncbi:LysR family transcriptional regulator [Aquabacter sp. CN5-332]|uniref:LysR family transcriptional regulator n=1 Tax=Aquabacter sp. CN5-332 TaxID=3156608 RepID=UPI0032B4BC09
MNDKQLEYFVRIAELGSFRKASEALCIAQPALTRQIQKLEEELGVALFTRGSRGIATTSPGTLLLERARFIRRQTEQAVADVMAEGTVPSGVVGFGAPPSIAEILFCGLSKTYLDLYPQVRLAFFEGVGHLRSWLLSGDIDIAILPNTRGIADRHVGLDNLVREPVYLVGQAGEFAPGSTCTWRDLVPLPLILAAPPSTVRGWLDANLAHSGEKIRVGVETESLQVQKKLVKAGLGYAVLPHSAVHRDFEAGTLTLCQVEGWLMDRVLAWRTDRPLTPAVQKMIDATRAEMARLQKEGMFGGVPSPASAKPRRARR